MAQKRIRFFLIVGSGLSDGGNYDFNCTKKAKRTVHDPPLLFDLHSDPGERYPLKSSTYSDVLEKMNQLRKHHIKNVPLAPSEMNKGTKNEAFVCCSSAKRDCKPFPTCCNCQ